MSEFASAVLLDSLGRLLLQLRDDIPNIVQPGKIGLFGGHREGGESFLDCIVREVHEELSYYLPPERFKPIACRVGPDFDARRRSPRRIFRSERRACRKDIRH